MASDGIASGPELPAKPLTYQVMCRELGNATWTPMLAFSSPVDAVAATLDNDDPNTELVVFENFIPIWETLT